MTTLVEHITHCTRCGIPRERTEGLCSSCRFVEQVPPKRWLPDLDNEETCPEGHWLVDGNARVTDAGETVCTVCERREQHAA